MSQESGWGKRTPNPKSSVLLVIDMQNYFYSTAKPILPAIKTTIQLCREALVPVIYTRLCHKSPADFGMLYEWKNGALIKDGTEEADIMPEVDRKPDDLVFDKNTYNAFRGTDLEQKLKEMGVEDVIVTGVKSNLSCETTAREAFVRGFRVFFSTDATASSSQDLHCATLKNMDYGFAYLVDCTRLEEKFQKMRIFVRNLGAKSIIFEVKRGDTIANVQEKIKEREGVSTDFQWLVFNGRKLEESKTVASYNIEEYSTLHLHARNSHRIDPKTKEST